MEVERGETNKWVGEELNGKAHSKLAHRDTDTTARLDQLGSAGVGDPF